MPVSNRVSLSRVGVSTFHFLLSPSYMPFCFSTVFLVVDRYRYRYSFERILMLHFPFS